MKWLGIAITSAIMGIFLAVLAQTAFPLTQEVFAVIAIGATVMIFFIIGRLVLTAGTIEVRPPNEWDAHQLKSRIG